jgi:hypothetical protein
MCLQYVPVIGFRAVKAMPANNGQPFVLLASFFNRDGVPSLSLFAFGMVAAIVRFRIIPLICDDENIIMATPPILQ